MYISRICALTCQLATHFKGKHLQQENEKEMISHLNHNVLFCLLWIFEFLFTPLDAITGIEFGDNKAKKYSTEDNGLAEITFKENMSRWNKELKFSPFSELWLVPNCLIMFLKSWLKTLQCAFGCIQIGPDGVRL